MRPLNWVKKFFNRQKYAPSSLSFVGIFQLAKLRQINKFLTHGVEIYKNEKTLVGRNPGRRMASEVQCLLKQDRM